MTAEKNFKCRRCDRNIEGHNQYLHDSMCDDCFFEEYFPDCTSGPRKLKTEDRKKVQSRLPDGLPFGQVFGLLSRVLKRSSVYGLLRQISHFDSHYL